MVSLSSSCRFVCVMMHTHFNALYARTTYKQVTRPPRDSRDKRSACDPNPRTLKFNVGRPCLFVTQEPIVPKQYLTR